MAFDSTNQIIGLSYSPPSDSSSFLASCSSSILSRLGSRATLLREVSSMFLISLMSSPVRADRLKMYKNQNKYNICTIFMNTCTIYINAICIMFIMAVSLATHCLQIDSESWVSLHLHNPGLSCRKNFSLITSRILGEEISVHVGQFSKLKTLAHFD